MNTDVFLLEETITTHIHTLSLSKTTIHMYASCFSMYACLCFLEDMISPPYLSLSYPSSRSHHHHHAHAQDSTEYAPLVHNSKAFVHVHCEYSEFNPLIYFSIYIYIYSTHVPPNCGMKDLLHPTLLAIDKSGDDELEEVDAAAAGADVAPGVCDTRGDCPLPVSSFPGDVDVIFTLYSLPHSPQSLFTYTIRPPLSLSLSLCVCPLERLTAAEPLRCFKWRMNPN